ALVQNRHAALRQAARYELELDCARANIGEIRARKEHFGTTGEIESEEISERHRNTVENLLERRHRGTDAVLFDEGNEAVGDSGALRQLTLGQAVHLPHSLEMSTHIERHGVQYFKHLRLYCT